MKKIICSLLSALMVIELTACGAAKQKPSAEEGFKPSLDKSTSCQINVAGGYDNFEALEAEFDRFNEYYPNVELTYTKIDDYNNMIGTVLNGNDAPDIYVNYSWMYGREQYKSSLDHAENLADPSLGLNMDCIRGNIILKTDDGSLPMVPVFSNTYGMPFLRQRPSAPCTRGRPSFLWMRCTGGTKASRTLSFPGWKTAR